MYPRTQTWVQLLIHIIIWTPTSGIVLSVYDFSLSVNISKMLFWYPNSGKIVLKVLAPGPCSLLLPAIILPPSWLQSHHWSNLIQKRDRTTSAQLLGEARWMHLLPAYLARSTPWSLVLSTCSDTFSLHCPVMRWEGPRAKTQHRAQDELKVLSRYANNAI